MALAGAFMAKLKNGKIYYRSSITYKNKHISLGSYSTEEAAHAAYNVAKDLISNKNLTIDAYRTDTPLDFEKYVTILNYRDNNVYIKTPIYLEKSYINYYLTPAIIFKFDIDDLFYFATHKISRRSGHFWVADYGTQINLYSRYGIKPHAVLNRDYRFINGDRYDFRYANIEIINKYTGVYKVKRGVYTKYQAKILVNGLYTIGTYDTDTEAAIAYNKAADVITKSKKLNEKKFRQNYIETISAKEYATTYIKVPISDRIWQDFS